jgi:glutamate-1-semialdehyde 2,1-aminomutase
MAMTLRSFERNPRTAQEAELLRLTEELLPSGVRNASVNPDYAMVIREARGSRITDMSGNQYIDYLLSSGPMLLGHAHPMIVNTVRNQLERGSSYLMINEPAIRLATRIVELVPCAEKVSFHSSGSEATFFATRLARAFRKRSKILKFEGGYHGMHDYALMSNQWTHAPAEYPQAVPNSAGIPAVIADEVLVAPFNDIETTSAIIERHHDALGAVIVEPLQRTFPPKPGFLQDLRAVTRRYEIPLIFDEVVTGFRLALGGAQEYYGVTPDVCALGKSISAGHPLGVVCGNADIMSMASQARMATGDYVFLTGTFSANPVSATAALACLEELTAPGCYESLADRGGRLKVALQGFFDAAGIAAQVTGEPSVFQPWFTEREVVDFRSSRTSDIGTNLRFIELLLERGVMKAHEKFFVSTAHSERDIEETIEAFESAVSALAEGRDR